MNDLVKNQSTGVDYGTLDALGWIFEYITNWPFAGALSADFLRIFDISKKSRNSRVMDIGNFDP